MDAQPRTRRPATRVGRRRCLSASRRPDRAQGRLLDVAPASHYRNADRLRTVSNRVLWTLPRSAKGMEVEFIDQGQECVIRLLDSFDPASSIEMRFLGVMSYSFTGDSLCTLEHIEAYDKVVELPGRGWGDGLASDRVTVNRA